MKVHVVAHIGIRPYGYVVHAHQLHHIIVVVQYALDILLGVVAKRVRHGGDGDQSALPGAGLQLFVGTGAGGWPQGIGSVVAEGYRRLG